MTTDADAELDPRAAYDAAWEQQRPEREARPNGQADAERERHRQSQAGRNSNQRGLELVRFADMHPRLDGRALVRGVLEPEQTSLWFGDTGSGKTFVCLDLALHVAAGLAWFGRNVNQGAVFYVATEAGRGILNRVAAFKGAHGFENAEIAFAAVVSPVDLCHPGAGDVDRLIATIRAASLGPVVLIIIDTVSRALAGGNENGPDDMGAFVRSLDRLRDELQCHVAAVHHSGKDQSKGSRGHSLLRCAVDTEIAVARNAATGISTATITKQRDGLSGEKLAFRLERIELGKDQDGEPVTSCVVRAAGEAAPIAKATRDLPAAQKRALDLLADAIARGGEIPPPNDHVPQATPCVTEATWRRFCAEGMISGSDKPEAKRKAFKRASEALLAAGRIGKWGELVWLIQP
jgi:AAA domain